VSLVRASSWYDTSDTNQREEKRAGRTSSSRRREARLRRRTESWKGQTLWVGWKIHGTGHRVAHRASSRWSASEIRFADEGTIWQDQEGSSSEEGEKKEPLEQWWEQRVSGFARGEVFENLTSEQLQAKNFFTQSMESREENRILPRERSERERERQRDRETEWQPVADVVKNNSRAMDHLTNTYSQFLSRSKDIPSRRLRRRRGKEGGTFDLKNLMDPKIISGLVGMEPTAIPWAVSMPMDLMKSHLPLEIRIKPTHALNLKKLLFLWVMEERGRNKCRSRWTIEKRIV
jgi:hypothetical protein